MSHAVEESSGSDLPETSDHMFRSVVGRTPTVDAKIGGVLVPCVADTGSMVSFVMETFFKEKRQSVCGEVLDTGGMLRLRAANGLEIPYMVPGTGRQNWRDDCT